MQTIHDNKFDLPMPFLRKGLEQVKELTSEADYKEFSDNIDTPAPAGYGFYEGEYLYIPNLPNWNPDKSKRKRILQLPKDDVYKKATGLVSVIRIRPLTNGKFRKVLDWFNIARLSEHDYFGRREFTDELRKKLGTEYSNDLERLEAMTGHLLFGSGIRTVKSYVFNRDGVPEVDENGKKKHQTVFHYTAEDKGFVESLTPENLMKFGIELDNRL